VARVGIDIDDVIYPWYDRAHELCVAAGITNGVTPSSWSVYEEYGCSLEEWVAVLVEAGRDVYDLPPLEGTVEALRRLRDAGHDIVFVTARGSFGSNGEQIAQWTREWLDEHVTPILGLGGFDLHFSRDKTAVPTDYFIDDNADNVRALCAVGTEAVLRTRPWNADVSLDELTRCTDLAAFVTWVLHREAGKEHANRGPSMHDAVERVATAVASSLSGEVRTVSSTGAEKGVKLARFDLIPAEPMWQVAEHFGKGARKYADRNWERGYEWSKTLGALERHVNLFKQGEDFDLHEPGCPADCVEHTESHHMAAAVFHALALMEFGRTHPEFDDRVVVTRGPRRSPAEERAS
jgi:hypothetical protein